MFSEKVFELSSNILMDNIKFKSYDRPFSQSSWCVDFEFSLLVVFLLENVPMTVL